MLNQGWLTSQRPKATFLIVLLQRATWYSWAHMNITPSIPHSLTHICSARFKYHTLTWQWHNFTSYLLLCMLFSGTFGKYVSLMKPGKELYGLATPVLNLHYKIGLPKNPDQHRQLTALTMLDDVYVFVL